MKNHAQMPRQPEASEAEVCLVHLQRWSESDHPNPIDKQYEIARSTHPPDYRHGRASLLAATYRLFHP